MLFNLHVFMYVMYSLHSMSFTKQKILCTKPAIQLFPKNDNVPFYPSHTYDCCTARLKQLNMCFTVCVNKCSRICFRVSAAKLHWVKFSCYSLREMTSCKTWLNRSHQLRTGIRKRNITISQQFEWCIAGHRPVKSKQHFLRLCNSLHPSQDFRPPLHLPLHT